MGKSVEERITESSALFDFFGKELYEELKRDIKNIIVRQIEDDLEHRGEYIIEPYEIMEIKDEALEEVWAKIKKMYKGAFLEAAEKSVERMNGNE